MLFSAMAHPDERLSQKTSHAENRKFPYFPCRHRNANSVHNGMANYFALENSNKK
jgi:hypothetical protein